MDDDLPVTVLLVAELDLLQHLDRLHPRRRGDSAPAQGQPQDHAQCGRGEADMEAVVAKNDEYHTQRKLSKAFTH